MGVDYYMVKTIGNLAIAFWVSENIVSIEESYCKDFFDLISEMFEQMPFDLINRKLNDLTLQDLSVLVRAFTILVNLATECYNTIEICVLSEYGFDLMSESDLEKLRENYKVIVIDFEKRYEYT